MFSIRRCYILMAPRTGGRPSISSNTDGTKMPKRITNVDDFDGEASFNGRSISDVARGLILLRLATFGRFVANAERLYKTSHRLLGRSLTEKLLANSFYAQFVAGDGDTTLKLASDRLLEHGNVKTMLCPPMEDLEGVNKNFESLAKENTTKFLQHLKMAKRLNESQPGQKAVVQYKLSAAFPVETMDKLSDSIDQESNGDWEPAVQILMDALGSGNCKDLPKLHIDQESLKYLELGLNITRKIFQEASDLGIPILIDAELKSSHSAMYALTIALAVIYNKQNAPVPLVYGTYQCYFKQTKRNLQQSLDLCKKLGVTCGAKLVRGAYMPLERRLAKERGLEDPIWSTYEETSKSYDGCVQLMFEQLAGKERNGGSCDVSFFVASHNKESVQNALNLMEKLSVAKDNPSVRFAQIYGMCDQISFGLGNAGYTVYKSIPWGSVGEWVPYLARRAAENHTAFKTARNEIPLYRGELRRRIFGK